MKITRQRAAELMADIEDVLGKRTANLTITEFAQIAGVHRVTIWNACSRGEIPASQKRKNCKYRIHYSELDPYLLSETAA